MTENLDFAESIESKIAMTTDWIKYVSERQEVREIPRGVLRDTLEYFGANFEGLSEEAKESLRSYSEKERGLGVRAVWGDEFVNGYKDWTKNFIGEYESNPKNRRLPELKPSGRKDSGMIQFLFDLTSFASGEYSIETFKTYVEGRVRNGLLWSENRGNERVRIKVPTSTEPILLSSIPREFPVKVWGWISAKK